ncbi:MAG: acetyl-CoA acetyltransferase [Dehalococcoidia bacterium]|jgi:acetyl-CoA acetyltransferase|nr:acetyl-CoA acetyltransferase [Dehalococcoidia bacterium]
MREPISALDKLDIREKREIFRRVAIVGVDESDEIGIVPHKSALQLHAEAARNALADAGIDKSEVDAVLTSSAGAMSSVQLAEYLGIVPIYTDSTMTGGSSFAIQLEHAALAIATGMCRVALITHGQTGYSDRLRGVERPSGDPWFPARQLEAPYYVGGPVGNYALACMRHMYQYGTTHEQLAEIAVATRKWAQLNPKALMREPLTIEDVLSSRWVVYPFHIYDCCLVTDAGGAVVLTSAERARDCRKRPVWVLGAATAHTHLTISQMPDLTETPARISGPRAMAMAGVGHEDIDVVEVYDSFTYTVLVTLEDLGFCAKGEGGPFVSGQRTAPGGDFPLNTNGGGLSYTHPGMYGIFPIIEAVRQLRGECGPRQVPGAKVALVNTTGGTLSATGTLVLGVE